MAEGIDVYAKYQTVTDWGAVRRAGKEFAYVKVSDGTDTRGDNGYVAGAHAAGIDVGGYHYAQFGDPITQARLLCNRVAQLGALDLAPALDLEDPFAPNANAASFAVAFLTEVRRSGHRPALYANDSMLKVILGAVLAAVPDVLVWCARYGAKPTVAHDVWQYSKSGTVPGIKGLVDLNQGAVPRNTVLAAPGAERLNDMGLFPYTLERGAGRHLDTVAVECGSNSQVVGDLWVSLISGFDGLSNVAVTFVTGDRKYGGDGVPGTVTVGALPSDTRRWWKVPSGCCAVSLDYVCASANSRPSLAFALTDK